ncbi:MAG TPA: hypothetical protein VGG92_09690 [Caulobacteraceae bacterium]|jgi:hypothetical protein
MRALSTTQERDPTKDPRNADFPVGTSILLSTPHQRASGALDPAILGLVALLLVTGAAKLVFRASSPLWFDEVWTGAIAAQRTLAEFVHQCSLDANAPLGYAVAWAWARVAGFSDEALRFPSAAFAALAPVVALAPSRAIPYRVRLVWAGLVACWLPGLLFATEARCYSLLLLLGVANTAAFADLMRAPALRAALVWASVSSLMIFTHYAAAAMVGCQGLAYLLVCRRAALRTWPAALALAPSAALIAAHAALLVSFSEVGSGGIPRLAITDLPGLTEFLFGGRFAMGLTVLWAIGAFALGKIARTPASPEASKPPDSRLWIAPVACIAAIASCVVLSLMRPLVVERYLTAMVPGLLLGIAMIAQRLAVSWRIAPAALLALQGGVFLGALSGALHDGKRFSFEQASSALMAAQTSSLVFLWDAPQNQHGAPDALAQIGGFFFHRAGRSIPVDPVFPAVGEDPNKVLARRAYAPGTGVIWLYDTGIPGTAALRNPPNLSRLDARWRCRDFGGAQQHVVACSRARTF